MKTKLTISKKTKKIKITLLTIATIVSCIVISGCKHDGCTDSAASNYDSEAHNDDGSCVYSGCMDPYADNYNSKATTDDGSCTYGTSDTYLDAKSVTVVPTIDGSIDALWANIKKLQVTATVPDVEASFARPGCDVFGGYEGQTYTVSIRSVYDPTNIYFLVEWDDATESKDRNQWYFDTATNRWKQEPTHACSNGASQTPHYEDKFGFMWNISMPSATWNAAGCASTCHKGLAAPWTDAVKHYTENASEKTDIWHWKYVRTNLDSQIDDQYWGYTDPTAPAANGGRFTDAKTSGGYSDNKQSLKLSDDTSVTVSVPKYVIPGNTNYYWITKSEIDGGTAKLVTAVDNNGVLTYSGGTIDPSSSGYEKETGTKRFPSIYYNAPWVGSRGDVTAYGKHTGTGWVLEIKRALNTGNDDDVEFDVLNEYKFGIGAFDNAGIAHAVKDGLTLRFQ